MKKNFINYRELFDCELDVDSIPQEIFTFILDNFKESEIENSGDLKSFNDFNELLSNIFSNIKSNGEYYNIGYTSHRFHTFLIGFFHLSIIREESESIREIVNIVSTNVKSGELKIEIPLSRSFLKLSWNSRQVFEQILRGFFDRLSFILFGSICKQVSFDAKGLKIIVTEPLGTASEIINSIGANRYNFISLGNFLIPKTDSTLISRITKLLIRDIGFSLGEISTHLNKSKRSIQRELKVQGKSFLSIKEETRRMLLKSYIKRGIYKIDDLADLLAYSERSSFEKAYKKWYGKTISKDLKSELAGE